MNLDYANIFKQILEASKLTIGLFFMTLIIALPLGLLIYFMSVSKFKPLSLITNVFIWIIRGTPLMLQIVLIFYGPGFLFKIPLIDEFWGAVIAFGINYAAYFAVIYKGGFQSIPIGQSEASRVLGLSRIQSSTKVILPQVGKRILQPMSNEIITLVKDTSLANVIGVAEVVFAGQSIMEKTTSIIPLLCTGVFYPAFVGILTIIFRLIEKRFDYYKG